MALGPLKIIASGRLAVRAATYLAKLLVIRRPLNKLATMNNGTRSQSKLCWMGNPFTRGAVNKASGVGGARHKVMNLEPEHLGCLMLRTTEFAHYNTAILLVLFLIKRFGIGTS